MANLMPPDLVAGAARTPLPYGLFSVLSFRPEDAAHWQGGGVVWEYLDPFTSDLIGPVQDPESGTYGLPLNLSNVEEAGSPDSGQADPGQTTATQFTAIGHFTVSPIAWTPEDVQARALEVLLTFEERQVEKNFWNATTGSTPNMAAPAAVGTVATADIHDGLAMLETYIGDTYGSLGVIHLSRQHALSLLHNNSLVVKGPQLFTSLGTPVVAGAGYPVGTIKATPALFGYRSTPFFSSNVRGDLLNKQTNDYTAVAERSYLIGFDPTGVGAVTITA